MSAEEFNKQQYLTLRDEIRTSKSRAFTILVLGTLFVPAVSFAAQKFGGTFASASVPFLLMVLMLAFVMEQNSIVRAGKYLKEHVEPHVDDLVTWESWLESRPHLRDVDRYFFATFLIVFLLFYAIATGMAVESLANRYPEQYWYAVAGYAIGGLWFVVVWLGHWRTCTTTA